MFAYILDWEQKQSVLEQRQEGKSSEQEKLKKADEDFFWIKTKFVLFFLYKLLAVKVLGYTNNNI